LWSIRLNPLASRFQPWSGVEFFVYMTRTAHRWLCGFMRSGPDPGPRSTQAAAARAGMMHYDLVGRGPFFRARSARPASAVEAGVPARHSSPRFTSSCIANCESPTIAWPALLSSRACRPRGLATAASIVSPGLRNARQQNLGEAVHEGKQGLLSSAHAEDLPPHLFHARGEAFLSPNKSSCHHAPLNSWSIAARRNAMGFA
jgi:hypothetical protein